MRTRYDESQNSLKTIYKNQENCCSRGPLKSRKIVTYFQVLTEKKETAFTSSEILWDTQQVGGVGRFVPVPNPD